MYCTNCGEKLNKDKKCPNCDKKTKKVINKKVETKDEKDKNISIILGIITIVSSFFLLIFNIPIGIVSIVAGHNYKKKNKEKCCGPLLAIIGMIISIIMTILVIILIVLFIKNVKYSIKKPTIDSNYNYYNYRYDYGDKGYLNGKWKLINSEDTYEFDVDNQKYILYKENDKENNYCEGTFKIYNNYDSNNDYYSYTLNINPSYCIINGEKEEYNLYEKHESYTAMIDKSQKINLILTNNSDKYFNLKKTDE